MGGGLCRNNLSLQLLNSMSEVDFICIIVKFLYSYNIKTKLLLFYEYVAIKIIILI